MILYDIVIRPIEYLIEVIYVIMNRFWGHPGYAVIAVSMMVGFMCLPLYMRADEIQQEESEKQKKLKKWVDHINRTFRGEERFFLRSCYYRQCGYRPYEALKGVIPLLLQVPFFLAAYHFLSNLADLQGCAFLFIKDMGAEDALIKIAGVSVNILPLTMTAINAISTAVYAKDLTFRQKIQPYVLALLFLILLYHSPAGLVLYWTCNNLFSLVKNLAVKYIRDCRRFAAMVICALGNVFMVYSVAAGRIKQLLLVKDHETLLLYAVIYILSFLPLLKRYIRKTESGNKSKPEDDSNMDIVIVLLMLTVLFGLTIPLAVIGSSPLDFVDETHFKSPLHFVRTTLCGSLGMILLWGGIIYRMCGGEARAACIRIYSILLCISLVDYFCFCADIGNMSMELIFTKLPRFDRWSKLLNLTVIIAISMGISLIWNRFRRQIRLLFMVILMSISVLAIRDFFAVSRQLRYVHDTDFYEDEERVIPLSRSGRNVMVIMLDRAIGAYVPFILEEKPELKAALDGFTFYPNTVSFGNYTNFGSLGLFGGYEYTPEAVDARDQELMTKKIDEALSIMPVLFSQNGAEVSVCDLPDYTHLREMRMFKDMDEVNAFHLEGITMHGNRVEDNWKRMEHNFFFYSLYRAMPTILQDDLYDGGGYLSSVNIKNLALPMDFYTSYAALNMLREITRIEDSDKDTLFMCDNDIAHSTALLQLPDYTVEDIIDNSDYDVCATRELNGVIMTSGDEGTVGPGHYHVNMAGIMVLAKYFDWMREQGVYDNTRIILVADHGDGTGQFIQYPLSEGRWVSAVNPLFLVKDFDSHGFQVDNSFMTNADTPAIAMKGLINEPVNPYTGNPVDMSGKVGGINTFIVTDSFGSWYDGQKVHAYGNAEWYHVDSDIFELSNWQRIKE